MGGRGPPAKRHRYSDRQEGLTAGLLNSLAAVAATSTGRCGDRRSRPGAHPGRRLDCTVRGREGVS
jgi:hypothetical protein